MQSLTSRTTPALSPGMLQGTTSHGKYSQDTATTIESHNHFKAHADAPALPWARNPAY